MKNFKILILIALAGIVAIFWWMNSSTSTPKIAEASHKEATYSLDGKPITMASTGIKYFGNEAYADINGDGMQDVVFLFTSEPGGSGIFYYAAAALKNADGSYRGTNGFLVGDRIAPQNNEINSSTLHGIYSAEININFAMRRDGEPFTTPPSQGAVLLLKVTPAGVLEGLMK